MTSSWVRWRRAATSAPGTGVGGETETRRSGNGESVKAGIHPNYIESKVVCSCGNTFVTRSTKGDMHLELCNECHPFFTGRQKLVDSGGRVERFQKRYGSTTTPRKKKVKAEEAGAAAE